MSFFFCSDGKKDKKGEKLYCVRSHFISMPLTQHSFQITHKSWTIVFHFPDAASNQFVNIFSYLIVMYVSNMKHLKCKLIVFNLICVSFLNILYICGTHNDIWVLIYLCYVILICLVMCINMCLLFHSKSTTTQFNTTSQKDIIFIRRSHSNT